MSYKNRAASEGVETDGGSLLCSAHGCKLPWSVSTNNCCSYHAWADPKDWPRITEELARIGPWKLVNTRGDTPTVADMKTRIKGRLQGVTL